MTQAAKQRLTDVGEVYVAALCALLHALKTGEPSVKYSTTESFSQLLSVAFEHFGLFASNLAKEEEISKASISKWQNGHALPPAPTRKTVINWVIANLEQEHKRLHNTYDVKKDAVKIEMRDNHAERQLGSAKQLAAA